MPAGSDITISFLVAAHNEEKKIGGFLETLARAVTPGVEVLLGLDGCTDATAEIARRYGFVRVVEFGARRGKSAVLGDLIAQTRGEIVIVSDVDWDVIVRDGWREAVERIFDDPALGGIVLPTANLPFIDRAYLSRMSLSFTGEAWGSYFLSRYQAATQTRGENGKRYVEAGKMTFPFTVNICRKKALDAFVSTGDDFERCLQLLSKGYRVLVDDSGVFLFRATDIDKTFSDMFRQRTRGSTVYAVLARQYGYRARLRGFMFAQMLWTLPKIFCLRLRDMTGLMLWYAAALGAFLYSRAGRAQRRSTEELWKLRATR